MAMSNWAVAVYDAKGNRITDSNKVNCRGFDVKVYKEDITITRGDVVISGCVWDKVNVTYDVGITKEEEHDWIIVKATKIESPSGVMFVAYRYKWVDQGTYKSNRIEILGAGVGCYGFSRSTWVGIPKKVFRDFLKWLRAENAGCTWDEFKDYAKSLEHGFENLSTLEIGAKLEIVDGELYFVVTNEEKFKERLPKNGDET